MRVFILGLVTGAVLTLSAGLMVSHYLLNHPTKEQLRSEMIRIRQTQAMMDEVKTELDRQRYLADLTKSAQQAKRR